MASISKLVWNEIEGIPLGEPFASARFLIHGGRAAVDQTLYRLAGAGKITRISRGVFVRPKKNSLIGEVRPGPEAVMQAIAESTGESIGDTPVKAERRFGLTTQMEMRPTFVTSGHSRTVKLAGGAEIQLRNVGHKRIQLANGNSKGGLVLLALWNRGRRNLTLAEASQVISQLDSEEKKELVTLLPKVPGWLSTLLHKTGVKDG